MGLITRFTPSRSPSSRFPDIIILEILETSVKNFLSKNLESAICRIFFGHRKAFEFVKFIS